MIPAHMNITNDLLGRRVSKHCRWDRDGKWIPGKCKVSDQSGIKKLMRAARRGTIPPARQFTISFAQKRAHERRHVYMTPDARRRALQEGVNV